MNEDGAVQSIYDTISDNSSSLVSGIDQNGEERIIGFLSNTELAMPNAYYAVVVACTGTEEYTDPEAYNANLDEPHRTLYDIAIWVGDYVVFDPSDTVFGATAATNFRDFTDRIVKLFRRDQAWFPSVGADPRYRIWSERGRGKVIRKDNDRVYPVDNGLFVSCVIRFKLSGCDD